MAKEKGRSVSPRTASAISQYWRRPAKSGRREPPVLRAQETQEMAEGHVSRDPRRRPAELNVKTGASLRTETETCSMHPAPY